MSNLVKKGVNNLINIYENTDYGYEELNSFLEESLYEYDEEPDNILINEGFLDLLKPIKNVLGGFSSIFYKKDFFQLLLYLKNTNRLPRGVQVYNFGSKDKTKALSSFGIRNLFNIFLKLSGTTKSIGKIKEREIQESIKESINFLLKEDYEDDDSETKASSSGDESGLTPEVKPSQLIRMLKMCAYYSDENVIVWGATGIGKTAIIRQVARELMLDLITINVPQCSPEELSGLPVITDKQEKGFIQKALKYFNELIKVQSYRNVVPEFWPATMGPEGRGGIIFLDELTAVKSDQVYNICLKLLDERMVGTSYTLPPRWSVWAATNRQIENQYTKKFGASHGRRFIHLTLIPDLEDWHAYTHSQDAIDFMNNRNPNNRGMSFKELEKYQEMRSQRHKEEFDRRLQTSEKLKGQRKKEYKYLDYSYKYPEAAKMVVSFLNFKPDLLYYLPKYKGVSVGTRSGFPNQANWLKVIRFLNTYTDIEFPYLNPKDEVSEQDIFTFMHGAIGPVATREFFAFKNISEVFPDIHLLYKNILTNPKEALLPPLVTQKLKGEEEKIKALGIPEQMEEKLKELSIKTVYVPAKTLKELGVKSNEIPKYRPDILFSIFIGVSDLCRNKLTLQELDCIVDYCIKLGEREASMSLMSAVLNSNIGFLSKITSALKEIANSKEKLDLDQSITNMSDKILSGEDKEESIKKYKDSMEKFRSKSAKNETIQEFDRIMCKFDTECLKGEDFSISELLGSELKKEHIDVVKRNIRGKTFIKKEEKLTKIMNSDKLKNLRDYGEEENKELGLGQESEKEENVHENLIESIKIDMYKYKLFSEYNNKY